jgi:hypothetical protein
VQALGLGAIEDSTGRLVYTNQFMVPHIMAQDATAHGWKQQPYFAVTVPDHFGYEKHFTLEGLVYRVNPDTLHPDVDEPVTHKAMYEIFKYRGLFTADGSWDTTVYKDENAATLSRNYAAAHLQLAFHYRRLGHIDQAITEMERVSRMFPDYTQVLIPLGGFYMDKGDTTAAVALFRKLAARDPHNPDAFYYLGVTLSYKGDVDGAMKSFDSAIQADPEYNQAYYAAYYTLKQIGQHDRSLAYLERWINAHPNDTAARQLLDTERGRTPGERKPSGALPQPPPPSLP